MKPTPRAENRGEEEFMIEEPIPIGKKTAPNRIVNQPMECNDADEQGNPSELTLERYRRLAEGGAGVIFVEALSVHPESRARKNQLRIYAKTAAGLEKLVREIRSINRKCLILFQIDHSGRFCGKTFARPVSVYPVADPDVHLLETEEIEQIGDDFMKAAAIAQQIGADGIDFKQCHGYLGTEMLRPANTRKDRFGGSFENRTRFFIETAQKIKKAVKDPSFILGVRFSVYEGIVGGVGTSGPEEVIEDLSEPLAFARLVENMGFHYLNVSAGIPAVNPEITRPNRNFPEGIYRHFGWTYAVKKAVKIPVIGSAYSYLRDGQNGLRGLPPEKRSFWHWAGKNLKEGRCDMVGIGRQSLADPFFGRKMLEGRRSAIHYCTACGGCSLLLRSQVQTGCIVYSDFYKRIFAEVQQRQ